MDPLFIIFLALFIPGLLTIALVVAIALPRAVRDEKRRATNHCVECGSDLGDSGGACPTCGHVDPQPPGTP
jgi:hypothetical protein